MDNCFIKNIKRLKFGDLTDRFLELSPNMILKELENTQQGKIWIEEILKNP